MCTEILLVLLGILLLIRIIFDAADKRKTFPPGPCWKPFIGDGPELRKLARKLGGQHLAFEALAKNYNTNVLGMQLGRRRVIVACAYDTVVQILKSEAYYGRPKDFFMNLRTMGTGKGITSTDGHFWMEQRTFLVSHLRALGFGKSRMEQMIRDEIDGFLKLLEDPQGYIDVSATLAPSILSILWTLTSGQTVKGDNRVPRLLQLLKTRNELFDMSGGFLNQFPWLRFIAPERSGYNLLKAVNHEIKEFIMETINEHKRTWSDGRCDDFIYSFLCEQNKSGKENFSDDQLVMVCLDTFIAGSGTTSNTIDFVFLAMILYPEVQEKVFQCLNKEFKRDEDISYADRIRVPYIEAVLLECQRYFPVVTVAGPRRVLETTVLDKYIIPEGTTVLYSIYAVHQDKKYWEDPENFRPERFLDENDNLISQEHILTFGLGKRKCLGDVLAKACIFLFFVCVLRKYKIECDNDTRPTGIPRPGLVLRTENYRAKFSARY
ncbi:hypothetical protein ABEB36_001402 [Hypothenemus hampei]|uniref:Cytochrome P450 305a1 n=1 Tax=Hypothenemus hampei TaxID=57062 RepID=A0ABD1FF23_HYPHA